MSLSHHDQIRRSTTDKLRPIQMNISHLKYPPERDSSSPSKVVRPEFVGRRYPGRHSAENNKGSSPGRPEGATEAALIIGNSGKQTTSRLLRVAAKTASADAEDDGCKRNGDRRLTGSEDDDDTKSNTSGRSSSAYYKSRGRLERFQQIRQKKQARSRAGNVTKNQETSLDAVSHKEPMATAPSTHNVARSQFRRRFLLRDCTYSAGNGSAVEACPDLPHDISSLSHSTDPSLETAVDIENLDSSLHQQAPGTVDYTDPESAQRQEPQSSRPSSQTCASKDDKDLPSFNAARRRFGPEKNRQRNSVADTAIVSRVQDSVTEDDGTVSEAPSSSFDLAMQRFGGPTPRRRRLVPQTIDPEAQSSKSQKSHGRTSASPSNPVSIAETKAPCQRDDTRSSDLCRNDMSSSRSENNAPGVDRSITDVRVESHRLGEEIDGGAKENRARYYRIVFHGVVALLSRPHPDAPKSGAYISYGEVISTLQPAIEVAMNHAYVGEDHASLALKSEGHPPSPSCPSVAPSHYSGLSMSSSRATSTTASSSHSSETDGVRGAMRTKLDDTMVAVRVDDVLTGGYAVDATTPGGLPRRAGDSITPRRTNRSGFDHISCEDGQSTSDRSEGESHSTIEKAGHHYGFLFLRRKDVVIAEELPSSVPPPLCETGPFTYVVASTNPQPILTGPSLDAPRTPAVVLPGSVHVVSLRMRTSQSDSRPPFGTRDDDNDADVVFLRLNHRRGWVADRRTVLNRAASRNEGRPRAMMLMREVTAADNNGRDVRSTSDSVSDEVSVGTVSLSSCSVATSVSVARIRRPPLRRRRFEEGRRGTDRPPSRPRGRSGTSVVSSDDAPVSPTGTSPGAGSATDRELDTSLVSAYSGDARVERGHDFPSSPISNLSLLSDDLVNRHKGVRRELHLKPRPTDRWGESGVESPPNVLQPRKATHFLMKVTAPDGLKILDAPHFQVNNLVRRHASPLGGRQRLRDGGAPPSHTGLSKPPSSIFHTMTGSFGAHDSSYTRSQPSASTDSSGKMRLLPRGSFFEASRRMEATALYTQGAGLIKLADNSGWAIVPLKEDLDAQYRHFRVVAATEVKEGEALRAYEEVGNAVSVGSNFEEGSTSQVHDPQRPTVWMRVMSRGGAVLESAPPRLQASRSNEESEPASGSGTGTVSRSSSAEENVTNHGNDPEISSSVGSAILDAVFRSKSFDRSDSLRIPRSPGRRFAGQQIQELAVPTLPCGMCVEVQEWEDKENEFPQDNQSFVRLVGGHGWIPRYLQGEVCAVETERPLFRTGSFWYRVSYRRGVKVRNGPSRRAHSIKSATSEGGDSRYFRFECGEFLRASEEMTVSASVSQNAAATPRPAETWVKLYRRHSASSRPSSANAHVSSNERHCETLATGPSEWVQVLSNGKVYLEECFEAPKIERRRDGWKYQITSEVGVEVHRGPSFHADTTNEVLSEGEIVSVNERITASGEDVTWLRLKDGSGWVPEADANSQTVMVAQSLGMRSKAMSIGQFGNDDNASDADRSPTQSRAGSDASLSYNVLIARLFNGANSSSSDIHRYPHS